VIIAPVPYNDSERLAALEKYGILDKAADKIFHDLTALAASIFNSPIARISLVDKDRQFNYTNIGSDDVESPRDVSFCAHAILQKESLIISDTHDDKRFFNNPYATDAPQVRFYAAAPLITEDGHAIGTLCVIDFVAKKPEKKQIDALEKIRDNVVSQLEFQYKFKGFLKSDDNRVFLDNAPDAMVIVNKDGEIMYVNNQSKTLFGYSQDEMIGNNVDILLPENFRGNHTKYRQAYQVDPQPRAMGNGNRNKLIGLRKNGTEFPVEISLSPITTDDGTVYISSTIRDASERQQAELILRKSEEKFAKAFSAVPDVLAISRLDDGTFIEVNEGTERIFGYDREELIGHSALKLGLWEIPLQRKVLVEKLIARGKVNDMEVIFRVKSGDIRNIVLSAERIEIDEIDCILFQARDITAQKQAEEAILVRDRAFSALDVGVLIADPNQPDHPIIYSNEAFQEITGYSEKEILGKNCRFLQNDDRDQEALDEVRSAIKEKRSCNVVLRNYRKDGTLFLNELKLSPILDDSGRLAYYFSSQTDITERIQTEEKLMQSQKMDIIGQMAGGVAHDFNNLLTVVIGNLQLLQEETRDSLNKEDQGIIEDALTAAKSGARLTHSLLTLSRKQMLHPQKIEVSTVVNVFLQLASRTIGKQIEIITNKNTDPLLIYVDSTLLQNALLNLAINSRDAMPNGGTLTVDITSKSVEVQDIAELNLLNAGDYVVISLTDTGIGMSEELIQKAQEPFFTTKVIGEGTGLGLSTVCAFAKQSGGVALIKSIPDLGTNISIYLPGKVSSKTTKLINSLDSELATGTETILVVDDEPLVRMVAIRLLEKAGYEILEAEDSEQAISIIESRDDIDLLFSDIQMPGKIDGHGLAHWVLQHRPKIKVLLTSGYFDSSKDDRQMNEEQIPFLRKPYKKAELLLDIRTVLDS
jgi:PAS domain S-box-containing protein